MGNASIARGMRRKTTKYFSAVVFVAAVGATFGGSAGATTKRVNLSAAYRATIAATSVKETFSEDLAANGTHLTLNGSGVSDSQGNGSFILQVAGESIDTVVDNGVEYLKVPSASLPTLQVTTPWVSLNLNGLTKAKLGQTYQQLASYGQQGPAQSLAILKGESSAGVKVVGTSTLFGVKTTEYRTTLDRNKIASASGKALAPAIEKLQSQYHYSSLPLEIWLDGQQRVRRLVEIVKASTPPLSATITVNIESFDVPVNATPPPAGQVTDVTAKLTGSSNE